MNYIFNVINTGMKLTKIHILNEAKKAPALPKDLFDDIVTQTLSIEVDTGDYDYEDFSVKVSKELQIEILKKVYKALLGKELDHIFKKNEDGKIVSPRNITYMARNVKSVKAFFTKVALDSAKGNPKLLKAIDKDKDNKKEYIENFEQGLRQDLDDEYDRIEELVKEVRSSNVSTHKNSFKHTLGHNGGGGRDQRKTHELDVHFDDKELKEIEKAFFEFLLDERSNVIKIWKTTPAGKWAMVHNNKAVDIFFTEDKIGKALVSHHIYDFIKGWKRKHKTPLPSEGKGKVEQDLHFAVEEHLDLVYGEEYSQKSWVKSIAKKKNEKMKKGDSKNGKKDSLMKLQHIEKIKASQERHDHHTAEANKHRLNIEKLQKEIDKIDKKVSGK